MSGRVRFRADGAFLIVEVLYDAARQKPARFPVKLTVEAAGEMLEAAAAAWRAASAAAQKIAADKLQPGDPVIADIEGVRGGPVEGRLLLVDRSTPDSPVAWIAINLANGGVAHQTVDLSHIAPRPQS